jgi:PAS domain S-box-containing protein
MRVIPRDDVQQPDERRYREVLDTQTDLVCRYLPDTSLTFVNRACCSFFDQPSVNLLGQRFVELFPRSLRAALLDHVQGAITRGRSTAIFEVLSADGSTKHQEWIDHAIVDRKGRVIELQGTRRDATRIVGAEQELETERKRVAYLARVALVGQLSGAFAHELRQPLTAILSNAQAALILMRHQPVDVAQLREILGDIVADDVRTGQIIASLISLLKNRSLEARPVAIRPIVETALRFARAKLAESHVSVHTSLPTDLPMVRGDEVQLEQVVLNLLINVIEAMSGTDRLDRRITVSAARFEPEMVAVNISDNGPGFGAEFAARLFEPYTTTKPNGLGLGLSICRAIIEAHHGTISTRNEVPRGATIMFTLPMADPPARG